jgi:uncharacterized protein (TIGR00290 family)
MNSKSVLLSWSSGKDSAWTLYNLKLNPKYEIKGLFTTITETFGRVSMHGVRIELLQAQAEAIGLPLHLITLPYPCSNEQYELIMQEFVDKVLSVGIEFMAFGDIYLEDVRRYREEKLDGSGITPLFPIWGQSSGEISQGLISLGFEAFITTLNPDQIPERFIGQKYNQDFLNQIPPSIDPCGENGEFHTFVTNGPIFKEPLEVKVGEMVRRDGFFYVDLVPNMSF